MKRWLLIVICALMVGCAGIAPGNLPIDTKTAQDLVDLYQKIVAAQQAKPPVTPTQPPEKPPEVPVPPITPTPILIAEKLVVVDLSKLPDKMRAENFQGRDGVLLYALGCSMGGRMWACNPTDGECTTLEARQVEIAKWFNAYLDWVDGTLRANPAATATLITNDERDRFGFILEKVLIPRFQAFGPRITTGIIIPESAY